MLFDDANRRLKMEKLDDTIEHIRSRFGKWSIYSATLLGTVENASSDHHDVIMPGMMYT